MAEKKGDPANIVMLKGLRLNMFDDQLYFPQVELTAKGKHKGKHRFNWGAKFILPPKDTPEGKEILKKAKAAMLAAKEIKWKDKADDIRIKGANTPLQDGDDEEVNTFEPMKNAYFLSASKTVYGSKGGSETDVPKRPFRVIGPRKVKQEDGSMKFPDVKLGDNGAPYSGCDVNVKVEFWGQDSDSERGIPNRINATILAVQFARDGQAFGGGGTRVNVDDEFDEEDVGGDGFDDDDDDLGSSSKGKSRNDDDDDDLGL